ncbi:MAG: hypothetical protein IKK15_08985, partial [Akkermansia sp.]|nr:hypothetical protein [Akkermansia sp.]
GVRMAAFLLLPVVGISFFYMSGQVRDAFIRCKLWQNLDAAATLHPCRDGVLYMTEAQWNALVADAHVLHGQRYDSELEVDRLVLKTDTMLPPAVLHSHKAAVTVYSVFSPEEQSLILLSSTIPAHLLHKCSADILLNRAVAAKIGLRGIVVVK